MDSGLPDLVESFGGQPGCRESILVVGLQAKVEGHELCWLNIWEDLSKAADYPVTNAIVEWAVYQGM